jgi:hypothetical protein
MAHRVAELIVRAETLPDRVEKEAAKRNTADLIIRLCEKRKHWLYASPLANIADFLAQVVESDGRQARENDESENDGNEWTKILSRVKELNQREIRVCHYAALAEHSLEKEREWIENHRADLSEEEIDMIERLIKMRSASEDEYFNLDGERVPRFASLEPERRTMKVLEILGLIEKQRQELYQLISNAK